MGTNDAARSLARIGAPSCYHDLGTNNAATLWQVLVHPAAIIVRVPIILSLCGKYWCTHAAATHIKKFAASSSIFILISENGQCGVSTRWTANYIRFAFQIMPYQRNLEGHSWSLQIPFSSPKLLKNNPYIQCLAMKDFSNSQNTFHTAVEALHIYQSTFSIKDC